MDCINYKMITIAREMRGYTQSEMSKSIPKLSQGNLSKIEKGIINVTEEAIEKIACFLQFPISFFYEQYAFPPFSDVYYRKLISTSVKKIAQLEATFSAIMFAVDNLLSSIDIPDYNIPELDIDNGITAKEIARRVRYVMGIQDGCIDDLADTLEKNGIIVIEIDTLVDKFSGMSLRSQNGTVIIFLNGNMTSDRKRFTIAHELGHIVMHIPFVDRAESRNIEAEANLFAGEFLMPYKDFRKDISSQLTYGRLDLLKAYWKVSKQAILYKAKEEKLIDQNKYTSLLIQLSMNGERRVERGTVIFQEPKLLKKIKDVFFDELEYTQEEFIQATKVYFETFPLIINRRTGITLNSLKHRIQL